MSQQQEELEHVWQGKFLKDDKHLKQLRGEFLQKLENFGNDESNLNKIESDINACENELQRIQLIKKLFKWIPVQQIYFERFQKSAEMSSKLREKANTAYKSGNYVSALRGYNLAIMFGTLGEEELGLAYGNRSALFVQIKDQHLALRDIQLALQCKYPENLKDKLLERQKKCNDLITRKETDIAAQLKQEYKLNGKRFCDDNLLRLKTPHPSITNAEEFVSIDYTEERGRRLVVNRNVSAGTVLACEEPYVYILVNYLTWDTTHCHFCSKRMLAGIPCTSCTFAMYCSEGCREKAVRTGHLFEHNILPYHHCHETVLKDLIATRIVAKAGPELLFKLFQRRKILEDSKNKDNSECMNDVYFYPSKETVCGYNENGVFESGSYLPVYHLISHAKSTALKEIVSNVFRAIVLTCLFRDTSNFFSVIVNHYTPEFPQDQFEEFVGALLLRHIENIPYNAISISELQSEKPDIANLSANSLNLKNCKSFSYATAIFCLTSLANHSCAPNTVIAKKSEFQQTALVTLSSLNAGDEIFISYKPQFTRQNTKERRMFLFDRYHFVCQCQACVSNWSVDSHLNYKVPVLKCPGCVVSPKNPSQVCKDCEKLRVTLAVQLETYQTKLYEADDLLQAGDFIQAIPLLQDSLQFFSTHFSPVFSLSQVAQDLYKRALVFLLYSYD